MLEIKDFECCKQLEAVLVKLKSAVKGRDFSLTYNDGLLLQEIAALTLTMYCPINKIFEVIAAGSVDEQQLVAAIKSSKNIDDCNTFGYNPLVLACQLGDVKSVEILLTHGANVTDKANNRAKSRELLNNFVVVAVAAGNVEMVRSLLDSDIDIATVRSLPDFAEGIENLSKVLFSLDGSDAENLESTTDIKIFPALAVALNSDNQALVKLLLKYGASSAYTPILLACQLDNVDIARTLLERGADVGNKCRDEEKVRPLTTAVVNHSVAMVKLLLEFKAKPCILSFGPFDGGDAIRQACMQHEAEILILLLKSQKRKQLAMADVYNKIKTRVSSDAKLRKYDNLPKLLDSVRVVDAAMDCSGGNADDKKEAAIVELGDGYQIKYLLMFNWSYVEHELFLTYKHNEQEKVLLDISWDDSSESYWCLAESQMQSLREFSKDLGLEDMPLEHFVRFLTLLLSRMVQDRRTKVETPIIDFFPENQAKILNED